MPPKRITLMGRVLFRDRKDMFGIKEADRLRHMFILGQTGTGKTTLIETMARSDIKSGAGVTVIDPHGDLTQRLLDSVPRHRINEVVYLNPADSTYAFSFNPLVEKLPGDKTIIASSIISAFQKTWPDFWGPRSEYLLRMALLALLEFPGMSLLSLSRFLADKRWRESLVTKLKDEVVKKFWLYEFGIQPERLAAESIAPIQNKIGALVGNPILRRILGQPRSRLHLREVLRKNKILLVNLSRGLIGLDSCVLLGSLIISMFEAAVLARAEQTECNREPFYLYVDEFSLFATSGFVALLAEGRKYGLGITLAQQSLTSLSLPLQSEVLTNSGTLTCFRLGALDAKLLAGHLAPVYKATDLMELPAHNFVLRLLLNGQPTQPFNALTLVPPDNEQLPGFRETIEKVSRERWYMRKN